MDTKKLYCDLCGTNNNKLLFNNHDRMFPKISGKYKLYQCKNCGLIFVNQPPPSKLALHYPDDYSVFNDSSNLSELRKAFILLENLFQYSLWKKDTSIFFKILNGIFYPCRSFFRTSEIVEGGNYLDVGCGMGFFPLIMKYMGMNSYGVEPGEFNQTLSKDFNLNIFRGELFDANFDDSFFDVITINHVLEHVPRPSEVMKELNRILKPDGSLIIGIPISDSLAFKVFGKYWSHLDTPRHLYVFSTDSIRLYAKKNGFKLNKIRYNSRPDGQFLNSFLYFLEDHTSRCYNRMIVYNMFLNALFLPFSSILNFVKQGDQVEITLKKIDSKEDIL